MYGTEFYLKQVFEIRNLLEEEKNNYDEPESGLSLEDILRIEKVDRNVFLTYGSGDFYIKTKTDLCLDDESLDKDDFAFNISLDRIKDLYRNDNKLFDVLKYRGLYQGFTNNDFYPPPLPLSENCIEFQTDDIYKLREKLQFLINYLPQKKDERKVSNYFGLKYDSDEEKIFFIGSDGKSFAIIPVFETKKRTAFSIENNLSVDIYYLKILERLTDYLLIEGSDYLNILIDNNFITFKSDNLSFTLHINIDPYINYEDFLVFKKDRVCKLNKEDFYPAVTQSFFITSLLYKKPVLKLNFSNKENAVYVSTLKEEVYTPVKAEFDFEDTVILANAKKINDFVRLSEADYWDNHFLINLNEDQFDLKLLQLGDNRLYFMPYKFEH